MKERKSYSILGLDDDGRRTVRNFPTFDRAVEQLLISYGYEHGYEEVQFLSPTRLPIATGKLIRGVRQPGFVDAAEEVIELREEESDVRWVAVVVDLQTGATRNIPIRKGGTIRFAEENS